MAVHKDAAFSLQEQAKQAQNCRFPARELREYRRGLTEQLYTGPRDGALLAEIQKIDDLRVQHQISTGCLCWHTREELEAALRSYTEAR